MILITQSNSYGISTSLVLQILAILVPVAVALFLYCAKVGRNKRTKKEELANTLNSIKDVFEQNVLFLEGLEETLSYAKVPPSRRLQVVDISPLSQRLNDRDLLYRIIAVRTDHITFNRNLEIIERKANEKQGWSIDSVVKACPPIIRNTEKAIEEIEKFIKKLENS